MANTTLEQLKQETHYSNYETWCVACWLLDDEQLYDYLEYYLDALEKTGKREDAVSSIECSLWDEIEDHVSFGAYFPDAAEEICRHALQQIDYHEAAEALADAFESDDLKIREWHLKYIQKGGKQHR